MSSHCKHDYNRTEPGVLALEEQVFVDKVKQTLADAINAYAAKDWHFGKYIFSEQAFVLKRHRWLPWKKVVAYTIPRCHCMEGTVEFYSPHEDTDDGQENQYVIHLSFHPQWIIQEVTNFMNDHGYRRVTHTHILKSEGRESECGFMAFEPHIQ